MNLHYCTECGAELTKHDETVYECSNGHPYYNNPHCGTCVIFLRDGKVLLAKRGIEPFKDKYCLPGGWLQHDEQPADGACREACEETSVRITDLQLVTAATVQYTGDLAATSLVYHALQWEGDFQAADDAASLEWHDVHDVEGVDFAWHYPGLANILQTLAHGQAHHHSEGTTDHA